MLKRFPNAQVLVAASLSNAPPFPSIGSAFSISHDQATVHARGLQRFTRVAWRCMMPETIVPLAQLPWRQVLRQRGQQSMSTSCFERILLLVLPSLGCL